jgi:hypothetical protein
VSTRLPPRWLGYLVLAALLGSFAWQWSRGICPVP